jgi:hypothetical protein
MDLDADLPSSGFRNVNVLHVQHIRSAELFQNDGLHAIRV